ncbi:MAG: DUF6448 family protein [Armatimonadota bacterium]
MMLLRFMLPLALLLAGYLLPLPARAHCDTMDGPVVINAQAALAKGDVTPVLKWVKPADEKEIRDAFTQALAVRHLSPEAQALADKYFFETLVRVHRAGEGAPYTGLKPAGSPMEPGVAEADQALASGNATPLVHEVTEVVGHGITERFTRVQELKKHANDSVAAGRAYVAAYVDYVHYVEGLLAAAHGPGEHHETEAEAHH